ncbi:hypothetical protein OsJ_35799 [Oryza sativa Japonica Group]|uniref:Uncharacterized protein n=1 Tax=Oryza sativa subsp. japonica TaxID=39947 RepID=B9GCQ6_ORYSJ|nr:hypothetical protein OsJ_35799 [Oryza sativa Japonica Group]
MAELPLAAGLLDLRPCKLAPPPPPPLSLSPPPLPAAPTPPSPPPPPPAAPPLPSPTRSCRWRTPWLPRPLSLHLRPGMAVEKGR